jgi:hypothetical protein
MDSDMKNTAKLLESKAIADEMLVGLVVKSFAQLTDLKALRTLEIELRKTVVAQYKLQITHGVVAAARWTDPSDTTTYPVIVTGHSVKGDTFRAMYVYEDGQTETASLPWENIIHFERIILKDTPKTKVKLILGSLADNKPENFDHFITHMEHNPVPLTHEEGIAKMLEPWEPISGQLRECWKWLGAQKWDEMPKGGEAGMISHFWHWLPNSGLMTAEQIKDLTDLARRYGYLQALQPLVAYAGNHPLVQLLVMINAIKDAYPGWTIDPAKHGKLD